MKDVYGDWDAPDFEQCWPRPLPPDEAGPGQGLSGDVQRRYLWIDAFGVLNFVTLAHRAFERGDLDRREVYLRSAERLVQSTRMCLGNPPLTKDGKASQFSMQKSAATGEYRGLRIGKTRDSQKSDPGMELDGMYWHYLDKWIFAETRLAQERRAVPAGALQLVKDVHPAFLQRDAGGKPRGLYWKLNIDLSVISGQERTGPKGDALSGWVVYQVVNRAAQEAASQGIQTELAELRDLALRYLQQGMHVSGDPLGYGLIWWELQFLPPSAASVVRDAMRKLAPAALDVRHGRALPFRLYGGILGAKLSGDAEVARLAETALKEMVDQEMSTRCGQEPHSAINKVMFCTALDPWAFQRRPGEEVAP